MKCPKCNKNIGYAEINNKTEDINFKNINTSEELIIKILGNNIKKYFIEVSGIYCSNSKCYKEEMIEG